MKYTMHDQAPREHRGIIMLPQYDGWSATWFDFATSDRHPAKIEMDVSEGDPWRSGRLHAYGPDRVNGATVSFYDRTGERVVLHGRRDGQLLSVFCIGDAVETIRLLTQDTL